VRTTAGRWRLVGAAVSLAGGALLLALSIPVHNIAVMLVGGTVNFVGVLLLGPVLVPACVRLLGAGAGRLGVPARLAAANAVRNPRRTAATAASLLVGVTLIAGLVTGMATIRSSVDTEMDATYPLDLTITATHGPLRRDALERVRAVPGVEASALLHGADATVLAGGAEGTTLTLLGIDPAGAGVLRSSAPFARPARDTVYLPWDVMSRAKLSDGARVTMRVGATQRALMVHGADGSGPAAVVSRATLEELTDGHTRPRAVWSRAAEGADATDVQSALTTVGWASDADVGGGLQRRADVDLQLDVMTAAVVAMLGIGVVIALVGIGNTLGLSVLERVREHAVLRALGLTRRQMRLMLATEAVLLATVAGLLGVALGAAYAWVGVKAVIGGVAENVEMVLPVGQLLLLVLAAAVAGMVACVLPARRAAQVAPAAGLSAD
jgi:putative ABC transport system permease protein